MEPMLCEGTNRGTKKCQPWAIFYELIILKLGGLEAQIIHKMTLDIFFKTLLC